MSTEIKYLCDRCKRELEVRKDGKMWMRIGMNENRTSAFFNIQMDLCSDCEYDFTTWLGKS